MELESGATRNLDHYREIHRTDARYGRSSQKLVGLIADVIRAGRRDDATWKPRTILDFGCGKSKAVDRVASKLGLTAYRYDPAIPGLEQLPVQSADVVMNTDVLEHLDRDEVHMLLGDVRKLSDRAFFNIATAPAGKHLPNGENAHATVEPPEWWEAQVRQHFSTVTRLPAAPHRVSFVTWDMSPRQMRRVEALYMWRAKERRAAVRHWLGRD